jgi:hypothetical protein
MTKKWHGGKGSTAREGSYSKQFKDNWDKIFGKKKERAGLNWELEDEQTHTEKAREDFLATREKMEKTLSLLTTKYQKTLKALDDKPKEIIKEEERQSRT